MLPDQPFQPVLLIVEDSDEDFEAFRRVYQKLGFKSPVYRCEDGDDVLDFLEKRGKYAKVPYPNLIMIDLNLPDTDGRELLKQLKDDPRYRTIPVIVLTTSANPKDVEICYQNGASSYLIKPVNLGKFTHNLHICLEYWFNVVILDTRSKYDFH